MEGLSRCGYNLQRNVKVSRLYHLIQVMLLSHEGPYHVAAGMPHQSYLLDGEKLQKVPRHLLKRWTGAFTPGLTWLNSWFSQLSTISVPSHVYKCVQTA